MDETKPPDEEPVESGFNEHDDFDFGEADAEPEIAASTKSTSPINSKKMLIAVFGIVSLVIAIMGYKTFRGTSVETPAVPTTMPENTTASTEAAAAPVASTEQPAKTTAPAPAGETHYNDIAAAFSEPQKPSETAAVTPDPTATTATTNTSPTTEGSIQDQKELLIPKDAAATNQMTSQLGDLNNGLNKLNHQIDYILNQIKYLDSYTREVSDNLNKLNDSIGTMDSRLLALTNTTSTLSTDMGSVRSEVGHVKQVLKEDGLDINLAAIAQKKSSPADNKITLDKPEYVVHAVIPGRAWLKSGRGQIVTVAEGDTIGDYGKILVIDAANGIVLTSSGVAFR